MKQLSVFAVRCMKVKQICDNSYFPFSGSFKIQGGPDFGKKDERQKFLLSKNK